MDVIADKGYTTGKHIDICDKNNITTYVSPKEHSSNKNGSVWSMEEFHL